MAPTALGTSLVSSVAGGCARFQSFGAQSPSQDRSELISKPGAANTLFFLLASPSSAKTTCATYAKKRTFRSVVAHRSSYNDGRMSVCLSSPFLRGGRQLLLSQWTEGPKRTFLRVYGAADKASSLDMRVVEGATENQPAFLNPFVPDQSFQTDMTSAGFRGDSSAVLDTQASPVESQEVANGHAGKPDASVVDLEDRQLQSENGQTADMSASPFESQEVANGHAGQPEASVANLEDRQLQSENGQTADNSDARSEALAAPSESEPPASASAGPEVISEITFTDADLQKLDAAEQTTEVETTGSSTEAEEGGSASSAATRSPDNGQWKRRPYSGGKGNTGPRRDRWTKGMRSAAGAGESGEGSSEGGQYQRKWTKAQLTPGMSTSTATELAEQQESKDEAESTPPAVRDPDIDYYEPKVGDEVIGVVVSSTKHAAELDIGALDLARLSAKEAEPWETFSPDKDRARHQVFVLPESPEDQEKLEAPVGQTKLVLEAVDEPKLPQLFQQKRRGVREGPIAEVGTAMRMQVVGTTINGAALVSVKKVSQRVAWQRVQQMQAEKEPFEVRISDWNTGGAVVVVEGLRAFIPTSYLLNPAENVVPNPAELVGTRVKVMVSESVRHSGRLILSQLAAQVYEDEKKLRLGSVVECKVIKCLAYGVMLKVMGTVKKGLMHISNVSRVHVRHAEDVFSVDETIKALVISNENGRIALSTRDLESSDGLLLRDKQQVWEDAEQMANLFRDEYAEDIREAEEARTAIDPAAEEIEETPMLANEEWVNFQMDAEPAP